MNGWDLSKGLHAKLQDQITRRYRSMGFDVSPWGYHDRMSSHAMVTIRRCIGAALAVREEPDLLVTDALTGVSLLVELKTKPIPRGVDTLCLSVPLQQYLDNLRRRDAALYIAYWETTDKIRAFFARESSPRPWKLGLPPGNENTDKLAEEALRRWPWLGIDYRRPDSKAASGKPYLLFTQQELIDVSVPWDDAAQLSEEILL